LGISLLVAAAVLDKKKIFTPFIVFALLFQMNSAMFDASRQDFLGSLVITGMTALLFKHKFKWYELAVLFVALWFYQTTFSPYALYARYKIRDEGFVERMQHSSAMLAGFVTDKSPYTSQQHREETLKTQEQKSIYYYRTIPLIRTLDRITLLPTIDTIIGNNLAADPIGAETTIWGFRLATPSALNPDKPLISSNNFVAHKGRGLVGYRDHGTQVAMGFTGDAFISYGWWGVFFASMVLSLCMVATYRMIFGPSLLFNAAAIGVMFKTTMIFTEGTMASIITNLITFAPVVCTVFLVLLWFANALVKRRELESMTVASPALPA